MEYNFEKARIITNELDDDIRDSAVTLCANGFFNNYELTEENLTYKVWSHICNSSCFNEIEIFNRYVSDKEWMDKLDQSMMRIYFSQKI